MIATKAARIAVAARGEPVVEFGLRRAQGIDGGIAASRAAYVGGCSATSNVLAGRLFGIPVRGTHAHSWVMSFDTEREAFEAYARALPNNSVFLVDTYDTLQGVRNAVEAGRWLAARGHRLAGIRLDSGDLAYLSIEARKILDAGGFPDADIVASNDLDEHVIQSLKDQGAAINVWGVGTHLVTAHDQPALGGVYKLAAVRSPGGPWQHKVKLSEQALKISNPGILQVRRYAEAGEFVADVIHDVDRGLPEDIVHGGPQGLHPEEEAARRVNVGRPAGARVPVGPAGLRVASARRSPAEGTGTDRQPSTLASNASMYPHEYPVGLEAGLFDLKTRLVLEARGFGV